MKSDSHNHHRESQLQGHRRRAPAPTQRRPQNRESQSALDSLLCGPTISHRSKSLIGHRTDITSHCCVVLDFWHATAKRAVDLFARRAIWNSFEAQPDERKKSWLLMSG